MQSISGGGFKGGGIVGVLIVAGILLTLLDVSPSAGSTAINGGISIGLILGILGILGVAKRVVG